MTDQPGTSLLSVSNLTKSFRSHWTYRRRPALKGVSFEIEAGDIFGFLGHNGAGKTTTIKSILGLIHPDSGTILFDGKTRSDFRRHAGYLPELPYFYDHLSVFETLEYLGGLSLPDLGSQELKIRADQTLTKVGLADRRNARVKTLSKGLQQRLGLAQAIINQPKLLFLDEPFSGLDPLGRAEFRSIITELNQNGTTVLISSHVLSDVQALCNRVTILVRGEVKKSFSLKDRAELFGERFELLLEVNKQTMIPESITSAALKQTEHNTPAGRELSLIFRDQETAQRALAQALAVQNLQIREFRAEPYSLEEIFLSITGEKVTGERS